MRNLKITLWLAGLLCLLATPGAVLPAKMISSLSESLGGEAVEVTGFLSYLLRVISITYTMVGVFFIILAFKPEKYGVMVPFSGGAAVVVGIICLVAGLHSSVPVLWYFGDFLLCTVLGGLILWFWYKLWRGVKREAKVEPTSGM